jgi:hypothetical protein
VPEARERLLVAQVQRLALVGLAPLGQVARAHHQNGPFGRVVHRAAQLDRERAAVLAAVDRGDDIGALCAHYQLLEGRLELLARAVDADVCRPPCEELGARVAELAAGALVEIDELAPAKVEEQNHVRRRVERGAEVVQRRLRALRALVALPQR